MTRWSLVVDDQTDQSLRAFLGQRGAKKGDLSKFIEEAVIEKLFTETTTSVKNRNADFDQNEIMDAVNEALGVVRADRH